MENITHSFRRFKNEFETVFKLFTRCTFSRSSAFEKNIVLFFCVQRPRSEIRVPKYRSRRWKCVYVPKCILKRKNNWEISLYGPLVPSAATVRNASRVHHAMLNTWTVGFVERTIRVVAPEIRYHWPRNMQLWKPRDREGWWGGMKCLWDSIISVAFTTK